MVAARLERNVCGSSSRLVARHVQGVDFGVRFPAFQMGAHSDDASFLDDDATDDRINACLTGRPFGELKREFHVGFVVQNVQLDTLLSFAVPSAKLKNPHGITPRGL